VLSGQRGIATIYASGHVGTFRPTDEPPMILLIDNYDSFAHNLARYFRRLHGDVVVSRNDAAQVDHIGSLRPDLIVLSPGPKRPEDAGVCWELVERFHSRTPIFGVCLGHQVIAAAFGGSIVRCPPVHGRSSPICHRDSKILQGLPSPFAAARYHSLAVAEDTLPTELRCTATTDDGTVMAIEHQRHRVAGVQFHPESILTPCGYSILANVLRWAGIGLPENIPSFADEYTAPNKRPLPQLTRPLTF